MSLWFEHGCFGQRMPWEHERYYGLAMDAFVSVCSRNTNDIMDAIRCVAAKTFRPNFYTLDPKVQLLNFSHFCGEAAHFSMAAVKRFTRQIRGRKQLKAVRRK